MAIKYESLEAVPEAERADFVEFKEGDKTLAVHKDYAEAKKAEYRLQGDLTRITQDSAAMKAKLDELSAAEKKRAEEAEAERLKGLSEAERQKEMIESLKRQVDESAAQYEARVKAAEDKAKAQAKAAAVADVAAAATDSTRAILKRMAAADLEVQSDGSIIVLDEDGKATAQTFEEYKASLKTRYPALVSAVQSKGGDGKGGAGGESKGSKYGANIPGFSDLPVS